MVDVIAESFDVAIRVGVLRDSSLTARKMASYRYLLVAAPSYLAKHGTPRSPDDLVNHACIGFSAHAAWPDWLLRKDGKRKTIRPAGPLVADNSKVVLMAVIEGAGITFAADWLAGPALRTGKLVEILKGWGGREEGGVYAVMPPGRLIPAKSRLFVEEIAKSIKTGWTRQKGRSQMPNIQMESSDNGWEPPCRNLLANKSGLGALSSSQQDRSRRMQWRGQSMN